MVVHEFRIPIPLTVEEFHRGQLHMVAQKSLEVTSGDDGEGVEWVRNEPYDNTDGHWGVSPITGVEVPKNKGQYTLKRYHIKSKIPSVAAALTPSNAMFLIEEAWNAYPLCKTVLVNGYLDKNKFRVDIETMHVDDNIHLENALHLTPDELKHRKVEYLDIVDAYADHKHKDYKAEYAVTTYTSKATGRGPLAKGWEKSGAKPVMCAYKNAEKMTDGPVQLVRCDFKYFGLQSTIEHNIINGQRDLFNKTLAQAFTTVDVWYPKSMADIRTMEDEVARRTELSMVKLREKESIPPVVDNGYHLKRGPAAAVPESHGGAGATAK